MSSIVDSVPLLTVVRQIADEADCTGSDAIEAYGILKDSGVKVAPVVRELVSVVM